MSLCVWAVCVLVFVCGLPVVGQHFDRQRAEQDGAVVGVSWSLPSCLASGPLINAHFDFSYHTSCNGHD